MCLCTCIYGLPVAPRVVEKWAFFFLWPQITNWYQSFSYEWETYGTEEEVVLQIILWYRVTVTVQNQRHSIQPITMHKIIAQPIRMLGQLARSLHITAWHKPYRNYFSLIRKWLYLSSFLVLLINKVLFNLLCLGKRWSNFKSCPDAWSQEINRNLSANQEITGRRRNADFMGRQKVQSRYWGDGRDVE